MKSNKNKCLAQSIIFIMLMFLFGCGDSEVESEDSYTDETPAAVESTSPAEGSSTLAGTSIAVTFSEAMDGTSISTNTGNTDCTGSIQVSHDDFVSCVQMASSPIPNEDNTSFMLQPKDILIRDQTYKIKITVAAKDTGNNPLTFDQVQNQGFTTLYAEDLSAGYEHVCAKMNNLSAYCWGDNRNGSLSTGEIDPFLSELPSISLFSDIDSIFAFRSNTCSLNSNSQIHCIGSGGFGLYGMSLNYSLTPLHLEMLDSVIQMDSGYYSHCAIEEGGDVKCWGVNIWGQLGNGSFSDSWPQYKPTSVVPLVNAVELSSGTWHSCAITGDQSVKCWGRGEQGKLGNGSTANQATAVSVSDIDNAVQLAVGENHSCALLSDHTVKCWGQGIFGQLGNDSTSDHSSPAAVQNISAATQLTAGCYHTCALLEDQTVECWGMGLHGQLGNGSPIGQFIPAKVYNIDSAIEISAGCYYTCAILSDHSVQCWGNYRNTIVITASDTLVPFEVPGI